MLSFQNINADNAPSRPYLELMAEALGLALANQRLRDALLEKALFDPLTGLRNRHHLEDTLHTQMAQAMRNDEPVSCLMIDIDHFKSINDRFGHEAGDLVIKSVALIVQRAGHDSGLAFRFGGRNFWYCFPAPEKQKRMPVRRKFMTVCVSCRFVTASQRLGRWMSRLVLPAIQSMPRATTCCAPRMSPYTGRKSWAGRGL